MVMTLQIIVAYLLRNTHPSTPIFLLAAYVVGGTANHNLFLAIHEITHNLAFKGVKENKLFAILANLPIGLPYAMMFKVRANCSRGIVSKRKFISTLLEALSP